MEYRIVRYARKTNETIEEAMRNFEEILNKKIAEGWQLVGGLCVDNGAFYQAIFK